MSSDGKAALGFAAAYGVLALYGGAFAIAGLPEYAAPFSASGAVGAAAFILMYHEQSD